MIEWKDRDECCFGYVAMVSDAIPERNLMTFTKGWFFVPQDMSHTVAVIKIFYSDFGTGCTDLRIAEADLGLGFVSVTKK